MLEWIGIREIGETIAANRGPYDDGVYDGKVDFRMQWSLSQKWSNLPTAGFCYACHIYARTD